ncbi:hypothetical protein EKE94_17335 [Mesobaculum littorinae]|uniref:Uncharacterized protein n=1 Tax=Mesobaculum littorinae TaxID=2486419 RepID=A0A438AD85_9RHOB|nr:hypothetical protein [Mesobaculum littorinae]RVV96644.1 hypothetical protein EKE94_17335 [Mesobaculum littorinae]
MLAVFGIIAVFVVMYLLQRNSSLTRECRWREDRSRGGEGQVHWSCVACGAETDLPTGTAPNDCLRPRPGTGR